MEFKLNIDLTPKQELLLLRIDTDEPYKPLNLDLEAKDLYTLCELSLIYSALRESYYITNIGEEYLKNLKNNTSIKGIKPIAPNELVENLAMVFPDWVIQGINNAIQKEFRGTYPITILEKDIVESILLVAPENTTRVELYNNKYIDFEPLYRQWGWNVTYDKPAWNEDYKPSFEFKPAK